jgi:hypothetical protein
MRPVLHDISLVLLTPRDSNRQLSWFGRERAGG